MLFPWRLKSLLYLFAINIEMMMHLRTYLVRKSKSFNRNQDGDGICEATLPPCGSNRKYSSEFKPSTPGVTIHNIVWYDVVIYDMLDKQYTSEAAL